MGDNASCEITIVKRARKTVEFDFHKIEEAIIRSLSIDLFSGTGGMVDEVKNVLEPLSKKVQSSKQDIEDYLQKFLEHILQILDEITPPELVLPMVFCWVDLVEPAKSLIRSAKTFEFRFLEHSREIRRTYLFRSQDRDSSDKIINVTTLAATGSHF